MVGRKGKTGRFFYQTPPDLAPLNYVTNIFEPTKKYKNEKTGELEPYEGVMEISIPG